MPIANPISKRQLDAVRRLGGILQFTGLDYSSLAWTFSEKRVDRIEELTTKEAAKAITSMMRHRDHLPAYRTATNGNAPVRDHRGVDSASPRRVECEPSREPLAGRPA